MSKDKEFMENRVQSSFLQVAKLHFERGDILESIKILEVEGLSMEDKDSPDYLESMNYLLRGYAELMDLAKINRLRDKLFVESEEKGELHPRTYYTLALCESHLGNYDKSLFYCRKSLDAALKMDDKEEICYAITGTAISYYQLDRLQEALRETYNLQVFFESKSMPQLQLTAQIINGHILRKMKKFPQALEVLWQSYELIKEEKNLYAYLSLLYGLGITYKESGDLDKAKTYSELAMKSVDKTNLRRLYTLIQNLLKELDQLGQSPYDIVYDMHSHTIVEKTKGRINFKNQFILLEMLKLFIGHPGRVFTKEEFIETIWKQSYSPGTHDNKIYVTIKRLRKMIEPDYNKPKYLFLAKNGYYFNKDVKLKVQGRHDLTLEGRL